MFLSLENRFIIPTASLLSPTESQNIIYLFEHTLKQTSGLIINARLNHLQLGDILEQLDLYTHLPEIASHAVLAGGSSQNSRCFVLHSGEKKWENTRTIANQICLTTSPDLLKALSDGLGPKEFLIALGCCHWKSGIFEKERAAQQWIDIPMNPLILFHVPIHRRFAMAVQSMGLDLRGLSDKMGHA